MSNRLKADGDTWEATLEERQSHPGVRAVVFHCVSNEQKGWRVAEVPAERFDSDDALERLTAEELRALFDRTDAYDYVHEEGADPHHAVAPAPTPREA